MDLSNPTNQAVIGGVIRSILVALGGAGIMSNDQLGIIAGALAALLGVAWSIFQKHDAAADKHQAVTTAVTLTAANPANANDIIAQAKAGRF